MLSLFNALLPQLKNKNIKIWPEINETHYRIGFLLAVQSFSFNLVLTLTMTKAAAEVATLVDYKHDVV